MGSTPIDSQRPLHIIIVGAGIGGLAAAVGLRRNGHTVDTYEQSRLLQETGAAIHMAPNSYSQLKRLGLDVEQIGGNQLNRFTSFDSSAGKDAVSFSLDTSSITPWMMVHRAQLHSGLKELALSPDGAGKPVCLHTGSRVAKVDTDTATVHFENGSAAQGDIVIGADGVHSRTRKAISGDSLEPFDSGKSAFRMLIPRDVLLADPLTAGYVEKDGMMIGWNSEDRRVIMYSCMKDTMMNIAGIHPSELSPATQDEGNNWHLQASKANLLAFFDSFGPGVRAMFEKVDEKQLKLWRLLDMDKMETFVKANFAVLGDAAHPFLPYQAQGGAQAIEDAMSLAAVLPLGTTPTEIPERLEIYNKCRYERSHKVQYVTRLAGKGAHHGREYGIDMIEVMREAFLHDEWISSTLALMSHLRAKHMAQISG